MKENNKVKYKITNIDYDVNYSDVFDILAEKTNKDTFTDEEIQTEIRAIKNELPKELIVEIDKEDSEEYAEDLSEPLGNAISDQTGWCVNYFEYKLFNIKKK